MKKEEILVFDEDFISKHQHSITDIESMAKLVSEHAYFSDRESAEEDTTKKQIIPYVILKRDNQYFYVERLKGGTESRLHNKTSIGLGGHVNLVDEQDEYGLNSVLSCVKRELSEEVGYTVSRELIDSDRFNFLGVINQYDNEVEKVHIGFVFIIELLLSENIEIKEKTKLAGRWSSKEELEYSRMETWSKIVFDRYLAMLSNIQTTSKK